MSATPIEATNFTATFSVDESPEEVFHAINDVRGWWSQNIDGGTEKVGDEFTYRHRDLHRCTIRMTQSITGTLVSWLVVDNYFSFTEDKSEWQGTEMLFQISPHGDKTEIRFTHVGLVPDDECFDVCLNSWDFYLYTSLRGLIRTGRGLPNQKEEDASV
jgi:Activator of Hsp90 ATPase homolog 1-like protein